MKSKIFKPMAVALTMAVGLGTTAMAASVTTTTNYTYGEADTMVEVTTNITAATPNSQVTFLVAEGDVSTSTGKIVYIDQAGIDSTGNANFTFKAKQSDLYKNATVTAKFGTDNTANTDLKAFKFFDGVDYITNGNAEVVNVSPEVLNPAEGNGVSFCVVGKISGDVSEYGLCLWRDVATYDEEKAVYVYDKERHFFPAYASEDGVFVVTVDPNGSDNFTGSDWKCEVYAIEQDGTIIYHPSAE